MSKAGGTVEVIARGVCVVRGHLLLCQNKRAANSYLPGGHVEFRERAADALAREIREEMGRDARVGRFLGCVEHTFKQKGRWHAEINLVFVLTIPGLLADEPPEACEDWITFRWCPIRALACAALEPAPLRRLIPLWSDDPVFTSGGDGWRS
jgi:8-oxo-dGTP diphosphatase